jgi:hypothetical protein
VQSLSDTHVPAGRAAADTKQVKNSSAM